MSEQTITKRSFTFEFSEEEYDTLMRSMAAYDARNNYVRNHDGHILSNGEIIARISQYYLRETAKVKPDARARITCRKCTTVMVRNEITSKWVCPNCGMVAT